MKKNLKYIILFTALLAGLSGCVKENLRPVPGQGEDLPYPTEGKAVVRMCVALPGMVFPGTKSMADLPTISSMRVVVFGSSGFLKESVAIDDFSAATTNGDQPLYTFDAHISLTDSKNLRVHVIANCDERFPWKYESEVMSTYAYTSGDQDAYWARFILPDGVTLKKVYDEESASMVYVQDENEYYMVTDDVTAAFCGGIKTPGTPPVYNGLPLVRNFAKISVESTTPQLVLDPNTTMAVINRPDRGSVAPYDHKTGNFLMGYKDSLYFDSSVTPNQGLKVNYDGFSPIGTQYVDSNPDAVTFSPCTVDNAGVHGGVYMYERPKPSGSDVASYIIIHGIYYPLKSGLNKADLPANWKATEAASPGTFLDKTNGTDSYYKIDFMDEDGYYAIFRNFRYHIRITDVAKAGADTPGAAGSTGGTADINQDSSVAGLTDISDGYGRIAVSYVGWTFVEAQTEFELKYKFIPVASQGDEGIDNSLSSENDGPVTITIGDKTGPVSVFNSTLSSAISSATGVVIDGGANGKLKVMGTGNGSNDTEGYRTIKFTVNTPDEAERTSQVVRITGKIDNTRSIYREVEFFLMPRQNMTVECVAAQPNPDYTNDYVEDAIGQGLNVNITIPKLLPESMFPLVFNIESEALSLTPNTADYPNENLPVESGFSICEGKSSTKSFHFVRTLSYDEYEGLEETLGGMLFTCHFKTNKAASAGKVYVDNKYFIKQSDSFYNYGMFDFTGMRFSSNNAAASTNVTFYFSLDAEDTNTSGNRPRVITVKLDGLVPQNNSGLTSTGTTDEYTYTYNTGAGTNIQLALRTLSAAAGYGDGDYAVTLNSYSGTKAIYHEASYGNKAQRVTVTPRTWEMYPGETKTLTASVWPSNLATGTVSWSSSNTSVATVDASTGKVTAVSVGSAQITATVSGASNITGSCNITVSPIPVESIRLNKSTSDLFIGRTETLTATVLPSNASDRSVTWSSSDTNVATVNAYGVVTGVAEGVATITATSSNGLTASCVFTVTPVRATGVSLNMTSTTLTYINGTGSTEQLTATVTPNDASDKSVTWSSSDESVATVNSDGLVTATGIGSATITVTTVDGGHTATCTVTVMSSVTVTVTVPTGTSNNNYRSRTLTEGVASVVFSRGKQNTRGYMEVESGSNITSTITGNKTIVMIVVHFYSSTYSGGTITCNSGSFSKDGRVGTWTGSSTNVRLTTSDYAQVQSVDIYYVP